MTTPKHTHAELYEIIGGLSRAYEAMADLCEARLRSDNTPQDAGELIRQAEYAVKKVMRAHKCTPYAAAVEIDRASPDIGDAERVALYVAPRRIIAAAQAAPSN